MSQSPGRVTAISAPRQLTVTLHSEKMAILQHSTPNNEKWSPVFYSVQKSFKVKDGSLIGDLKL